MFRRILSHRGVLAAIATVLVLLLLASWHYWTIVSSLSDARAQLLDVEEHLSDIGLDLTSEELAHTQAPLAAAGRDLGRARTHLRLDPLLHLGRLLPGPGEQIEALDRVLRMGEILLAIGEQATAAAGKAVALRENPPEGTQLAVALTGLLADIEPEMDRIDALLDELVATRFELGDGPLLPPLDATRSRIDADLPALANSLESLSRLRAFAPRFLGFEGERRYLVLALNEGQLMPGGGFVTATGVLTLRDGTPEPLSLRDAGTWRTLWLARGGSYIEPPGPLRRYLLKSYTWNLTVINWSPHFPHLGGAGARTPRAPRGGPPARRRDRAEPAGTSGEHQAHRPEDPRHPRRGARHLHRGECGPRTRTGDACSGQRRGGSQVHPRRTRHRAVRRPPHPSPGAVG